MIVTVAVPLFPPKQLTLVPDVVAVSNGGSVIVMLAVAVQERLSVMVTV
jgi:hypothetical protein